MPLNVFKSYIGFDRSKAVLLFWTLFYYMFHVCLCYAVLSVPCSFLITGYERADLLALLRCVFV